MYYTRLLQISGSFSDFPANSGFGWIFSQTHGRAPSFSDFDSCLYQFTFVEEDLRKSEIA